MAQPDDQRRASGPARILAIFSLIYAGEAIFSLPFHVGRYFREPMLRVFGVSNTQLGLIQAAYGVVAMLAYLGGPTADRFAARRLIAASLVATSLGGLYMATIPGFRGMWLLFGYFGLTTILLFWGALVRATRDWGGSLAQGRAFGAVDSGRGLMAAGVGSLAIVFFGALLPDDPAAATTLQRAAAMRSVVLLYAGATFLAAVLVWFFIPEHDAPREQESVWTHIRSVLKLPAVWLQAVIIICAYVAYKGLDNFSLYAVQGYQLDAVRAAGVANIGAWVRPFAAIGAGLLGDVIRPSRVVTICFAMLAGTLFYLGLRDPTPKTPWLLTANIVVTCAATFGLRGVYFALFEEAKVPTRVTGTAAGLVSVAGYTPDIFVAPIGGWLLDRSPGLPGHRHYWIFIGAFALVGLLVVELFQRLIPKEAPPPRKASKRARRKARRKTRRKPA